MVRHVAIRLADIVEPAHQVRAYAADRPDCRCHRRAVIQLRRVHRQQRIDEDLDGKKARLAKGVTRGFGGGIGVHHRQPIAGIGAALAPRRQFGVDEHLAIPVAAQRGRQVDQNGIRPGHHRLQQPEFTSRLAGFSSTDEPVSPFDAMYACIAPQDHGPRFGMTRPMQDTFCAAFSSTIYCAAPTVDGSGPRLVETIAGLSRHSDTAQAEAIVITAPAW